MYPSARNANINRNRTAESRIRKAYTASNCLPSALHHNGLSRNILGRWLEIYLFGQRRTQLRAVVAFLQFYPVYTMSRFTCLLRAPEHKIWSCYLYTEQEAAKLVENRAERIELFTARLLCRATYRVLEYSIDTGSTY